MATPFSIDLNPPYIMVNPVNSKYSLTSLSNISIFGNVYQINSKTTSVVVGDTILYNVFDAAAINDDGGNLFYVIDETKILFSFNSNSTKLLKYISKKENETFL